MNSRSALVLSAVAGFTAVALGAFGAHVLKARLSPSELAIWDKAVLYQLVHSVSALAASLTMGNESRLATAWLRRAVACWLFGILGFSGSLYALVLGAPPWLGPITPLGGLLLLAGWLFVVFYAGNRRSSLAE